MKKETVIKLKFLVSERDRVVGEDYPPENPTTQTQKTKKEG